MKFLQWIKRPNIYLLFCWILVFGSPVLLKAQNCAVTGPGFSPNSIVQGGRVCLNARVVSIAGCLSLDGAATQISGNELILIFNYTLVDGICIQLYEETDIQECVNISTPGVYTVLTEVYTNNALTESCNIGQLEVVSQCSMNSASLQSVACDDNGTLDNPDDDFITFTLNPIGQNTGSYYRISSDEVTITPAVATYNRTRTFSTEAGAAGGGNFSIRVNDEENLSCAVTVTVPDPGACSEAAVCEAPVNSELTAEQISANEATLRCTREEGAQYEWRYRQAGQSIWNASQVTSINSIYLNNLFPATSYEFQARIDCGDSFWSDWSAVNTFRTSNAPEPTCRTLDSLALVELYNATNGPQWTNTWDLQQPIDTWFGVFLNAEGCVEVLDLDGIPDGSWPFDGGNNLTGSLTDLNLPSLKKLYLHGNQLSGEIPDFSNLPRLEQLFLYTNQLSGSIPDFSKLPQLSILDLGSNQLSGSVPDFSNLPNLRAIHLSYNQLSGSVPNFSNLPNLIFLLIKYNQLSGTVPDFSDLRQLTRLTLGGNQLSGSIPDFSKLPQLEELYLYENKLDGSIPDFSNLPQLTILSLSDNQLSGSIPDFSNLPHLEELYLYKNQLNSTIPNFSNLPQLEMLGLSNNQLVGLLPNFSSTPLLYLLWVDGNLLYGRIPDFSGNLSFLTDLKIDYNLFTFSSILPNIQSISELIEANAGNSQYVYQYAPQDSIFSDTTITFAPGQNLVIDLGIDENVATNRYAWTKGGQPHATITGVNKLSFTNIQAADAGFYRVEVTNPGVPDLTLVSRSIRLQVSALCIDDNTPPTTDCLPSPEHPIEWPSGFNTNTVAVNTPQDPSIDPSITGVPVNVSDDCDPEPAINFQDAIEYRGSCQAPGQVIWVVTRIWTVSDESGNATECTQTFEFVDTTPPAADCPPSPTIPIEWPAGFNTTPMEPNTPQDSSLDPAITGEPLNVRDNCDPEPMVGYQDVLEFLGPCETPGQVSWKLTRNWIITDDCGNFTRCTQVFELIDTDPPPRPIAMASAAATQVAPGETIQLSGSASGGVEPYSYLWTGPNGFTSTEQNPAISPAALSDAGVYTLIVSNSSGGCASEAAEVEINLVPIETGDPLIVRVADAMVDKGNSFCLDVRVENFSELLSASWTMTYDPALLTFESVQNVQIPGVGDLSSHFGTPLNVAPVPEGFITFAWISSDLTPLSFADGTSVFQLCFKAANSGTSLVETNGELAPVDVIDAGEQTVSLTSAAGNVIVLTESCRRSDSLALVDFYFATNGSEWVDSWDLQTPIASWRGVDLNEEGCVMDLNLARNNLSGSIIDLNLPKLQTLDLSDNLLSGNVPDLSNLPALRFLNLNSNQLNGSIPDFSSLPALQSLNLRFNKLSGGIPNFSNLLNLKFLNLIGNELSGAIPIFSNVPLLQGAWLNQNKLSGNIPKLSDNVPLLRDLEVDNNFFTFSDILPHYPSLYALIQENSDDSVRETYSYAPQMPVFTDTTIAATIGGSLTFDLGIDENVADNRYVWYKGDQVYATITGVNKLALINIQPGDASVYTVEITNPGAPELTLVSHPIRLEVEGINQIACRQSDSLALVDFYFATNGSEWTNRWDLQAPMDSWHGVTLNDNGCVSMLELNASRNNCSGACGGNGLIGTIPDLSLKQIQILDLTDNELSGNIPDFSTLPNLQSLYLSSNQLSGNIPDFSTLPNLQYLGLSSNQLSGNIPDFSNLPNLQYLYLSSNQLSGSIPDFSNLPNLQSLELPRNQLSGSIPDFSNLLSLQFLSLSGNQLSGDITDFSNLLNLKSLELHLNQLIGSIPDFSNLSNLQRLKLHHNQLIGSIPDFSNLPNLQYLELHHNQLIGSIPDFSNLSSLEILTLWVNQLSGSVPNFSNSPNLQGLFLYNNQLSGSIPDFSNLPNLQSFDLSNNQLSGSIPDFSNNLPLLRNFEINENFFTFSSILPHYQTISTLIQANAEYSTQTYQYAPQRLIFSDTAITVTLGANLTIDLAIDENIADNRYAWYKDGQIFTTITGVNKLAFTNIQPGDAGVYTVEVTNPGAPELTLVSYPIRLEISANCTENLLLDVQQPDCFTAKGAINILINDHNSALEYSVDGGASFQVSDRFTDLTPGSYEVVVRGVDCEAAYEQNPVVINEAPTTDCDRTALLYMRDTAGVGGSTLDMPVYARGVENIFSLQGSFEALLPEVVRLTGVKAGAIDPVFREQFFLYSDPAGQGVPIGEDEILFYLTVELTGNPGDQTPLVFSDRPLPLEISSTIDGTGQILRVQTQNAIVSILANYNLAGEVVYWKDRQPLENVSVLLTAIPPGNSPAIQELTDAGGAYQFEQIPAGTDWQLAAAKDERNYLGLSTYPLFIAQQYLSGLDPSEISQPYQIIAADANCDGTFSSADLDLFQQLLVGFIENLGDCPSWIFIPERHNFSGMSQPAIFSYPETEAIANLDGDWTANFIGVKRGDILGQNPVKNLEEEETLNLSVERLEQNGEEWLVFKSSRAVQLTSLQLALDLGSPEAEVVELRSDILPQLVVGSARSGRVRLSWYLHNENDGKINAGEEVFRMRIQNAIRTTSIAKDLRPEAFDIRGKPYRIQIREAFTAAAKNLTASFQYWPPYPNPAQDQITLKYRLEKVENLRAAVSDPLGRTLFLEEWPEYAGLHERRIDCSDWPEGLYLVHLITSTGKAVVPVVIQR